MKNRRDVLTAILFAAAAIAIIFLVLFHQPLYGWATLRLFTWEEESFNGRSLADLQSNLTSRGMALVPIHADSFFAHSGRSLKPNQRAMNFVKGKEYRWWVGTAVNVGYVVVEKEGEVEKVVEIFRSCEVDSM